MAFNSSLHSKNNQSAAQTKPWHFSYLGGNVDPIVDPPPINSVSLVDIQPGSWVQIVALPRNSHFPIVGVAVGTYLLVLGKTDRAAVRVQVIGKQVTLGSAIAQQIYVQPFKFNN